jgi:hypothetical protein
MRTLLYTLLLMMGSGSMPAHCVVMLRLQPNER